jgi:uncharacterized membrane protein
MAPWVLAGVATVGKGEAMEKKLCIASMSVAAVLLLAFVIDMPLGIPFGGGSTFMMIDIVGAIVGGILLYLSWNALKDVL